MVSYFASSNSDSDVADASNCPQAAYLTLSTNSPDERGFKSGQSGKST